MLIRIHTLWYAACGCMRLSLNIYVGGNEESKKKSFLYFLVQHMLILVFPGIDYSNSLDFPTHIHTFNPVNNKNVVYNSNFVKP